MVPVSIHWHGYPVPNDMDGIPGMTQNAVKPERRSPTNLWQLCLERTGTIRIRTVPTKWIAACTGRSSSRRKRRRNMTAITRWRWTVRAPDMLMEHARHGSQQYARHGSQQIMQGMDHSNMQGMDHSNMQGMDHSNMQGTSGGKEDLAHDEMMRNMYSVFSVNGKSGAEVEPLKSRLARRFGCASSMRACRHTNYISSTRFASSDQTDSRLKTGRRLPTNCWRLLR